ncbi:hypothetical protein [Frondihabitans sucicola]|nr:hypothetical protein [Frondihabitans sucicola]
MDRARIKLKMKAQQDARAHAENLAAARAREARRAVEQDIYDRAAAARGERPSTVITNQHAHDLTAAITRLLAQGAPIMAISKSTGWVTEQCACEQCDALRRRASNDARTMLLGG